MKRQILNETDSEVFKAIQKRLRLYGKPAEADEIAEEVARLLLGDSEKLIDPLNVSQVARELGFRSRTTIYSYIELAVEKNFMELDEDGKFLRPSKTENQKWKLFSKNHPCVNHPIIKKWHDAKLRNPKHEALPSHLSMIEKILNTCRIDPSELIASKKSAEKYKNVYIDSYIAKTSWSGQKNPQYKASLEGITYCVNYAVASLCMIHGISWEKGNLEMSRKIVGHGKYAHLRLNSEEYVKADEWMKENYGLDSDLYRWFWFGVESGARNQAMTDCKLQWTLADTKSKCYLMEVYEKKTKWIQDGRWTKYILRPDTQKSLKLLKERGGTRLYDEEFSLKFTIRINNELRELWKYLGKDGFFLQRPTHVLRHLCAHYHLAKGNYANHSLVAKIGGWHTVDELIKSYGEIPPEIILQELERLEMN